MKSSPASSSFTALALKIVGLVMIVSSLLDYILAIIPFNIDQREWQIAVTTQFVDRGIIPLVGIALVLLAYRIDSAAVQAQQKSLFQDLRFWLLSLSSLLGLIYLLLVPLHFYNVYAQSDEAFKQINQKATQAETQLQAQTQQVDALIKDPQRLSELEKAIASGQVQGEQLTRLQALRQQLDTFKKDPKALGQQVDAAKKQISKGKEEAENRARTEALKLGLRTGLSSLFLAIGYIVVGWTGLRSLGS
ncbi:MAG TPA: HpsJ family protein [Candidatus Sericytochromatia bacterium]|jgi:hypothetical protein